MERHHTEQGEALVEVRVLKDSLEAVTRPKSSPADSHSCFKCTFALATVMGFIVVALVVGFILHLFMFTPSWNQDVRQSTDTAKLNMTCKLKMSSEHEYDIFTANKLATYLIYGWVKFSNDTSEEVILMHTMKKDRLIILKKKSNEEFFFLGEKFMLRNGSRISIYFKSNYTDSSFNVYEL